MNRQAQSALLFLLGATLLHAGLTDLHLRYVKAGLRPLILLAGAVLLTTALATAWQERGSGAVARQERASGPTAGHPGPPADHSGPPADPPGPRVAWLLTLPVLALILVAPPPLGAYSALHAGTALREPYGHRPLPPGEPVALGLGDYASRAAYGDAAELADLRGRTVRLTGFVAVDAAGTPYLVRMTLNCCAADAQPVKVALKGGVPAVLRPDAWLEITGRYAPGRLRDPVNGGPIPYVEVTEAKPVPRPRNPYDESAG